MSLLEGEKDKIIKDALELLIENHSTDFLTKKQQEEVEINPLHADPNSHLYPEDDKAKQSKKIIYNIERRYNKLAEISLLANAEKIFKSKLDLIATREKEINNKYWKNDTDNSELKTLHKERDKISNKIGEIQRELLVYNSHKSGGKRKTKKNKSRRRKTKKTKN